MAPGKVTTHAAQMLGRVVAPATKDVTVEQIGSALSTALFQQVLSKPNHAKFTAGMAVLSMQSGS